MNQGIHFFLTLVSRQNYVRINNDSLLFMINLEHYIKVEYMMYNLKHVFGYKWNKFVVSNFNQS